MKIIEKSLRGIKLPEKFSDAILAACRDLTKVEKLKGYRVNMNQWFVPILEESGEICCEVCFAGSLLACSGGMPRNAQLNWVGAWSTRLKLYALNSIRAGLLSEALNLWPQGRRVSALVARDLALLELPELLPVTGYSRENSTQFKADMRRIARTLAKRGL